MRVPGPTIGAVERTTTSDVQDRWAIDLRPPVPLLRLPELRPLLIGVGRLAELHRRNWRQRDGRTYSCCAACLCTWPCPTRRVLVTTLRAVTGQSS
jgi:hypothetical protein